MSMDEALAVANFKSGTVSSGFGKLATGENRFGIIAAVQVDDSRTRGAIDEQLAGIETVGHGFLAPLSGRERIFRSLSAVGALGETRRSADDAPKMLPAGVGFLNREMPYLVRRSDPLAVGRLNDAGVVILRIVDPRADRFRVKPIGRIRPKQGLRDWRFLWL